MFKKFACVTIATVFILIFTSCMPDGRVEYIATATSSLGNQIVLVSEVEVSRTEIAFSLKNTTDMEFNYGEPWDLAHYENGRWRPVPHLPGVGGAGWTSIGFSLQGGGIQQYRQHFEWHFGILPPGRYMFIREGRLNSRSPGQQHVYVLVEFEITANTPMYLPPAPEQEWPVYVEIVEISNITSTGMNIVVENVSPYGIEHRAQIIFIIPTEHATTGEPWQWPQHHHLPFLSFGDMMQAHGFIPPGESREFEIYLVNLFGELPPGSYKLDLSIGGPADPPHPGGWAFGSALIEFTVEP